MARCGKHCFPTERSALSMCWFMSFFLSSVLGSSVSWLVYSSCRLRHAGEHFPSVLAFEGAAEAITQRLYEDARQELGSRLDDSHVFFHLGPESGARQSYSISRTKWMASEASPLYRAQGRGFRPCGRWPPAVSVAISSCCCENRVRIRGQLR